MWLTPWLPGDSVLASSEWNVKGLLLCPLRARIKSSVCHLRVGNRLIFKAISPASFHCINLMRLLGPPRVASLWF